MIFGCESTKSFHLAGNKRRDIFKGDPGFKSNQVTEFFCEKIKDTEHKGKSMRFQAATVEKEKPKRNWKKGIVKRGIELEKIIVQCDTKWEDH